MAATPTVSVVIPAHNAERTVERCLQSVAEQTLADLEVVFVDDASSDETAMRAANFLAGRDLRHRLLRNRENEGPAAARNAGVAAAQGRYVAFLDTDHQWYPKKLEKQVSLLDSDPNITLCGCQAVWVRSDGRISHSLFQGLPTILEDGWKRLLWECYIVLPCAVARGADLGTAPFNTRLRIGEDRDLWIRLASNGKVALVQDELVRIEIREISSMSRYANLISSDIAPMIAQHLDDFEDYLSWKHRWKARGKLASDMGKVLCSEERLRSQGRRHLIRAAALGFHPVDSIRHMIMSMPAVQHLRRSARRLGQKLWCERLRGRFGGQR